MPFSRQIQICCLIFHSSAKKVFCPLFRSAWKNCCPFPSNLNNFCFTTGAFNFSLHPFTVLSTKHILKSTLATAPAWLTVNYHLTGGVVGRGSHFQWKVLCVHLSALRQSRLTRYAYTCSFWEADGNWKRIFGVIGPCCLPDFYTTHLWWRKDS